MAKRKTKAKEPEFPDILYVRRDAVDPGEPSIFLAEDDMANHATVGGRTRVSVYELVDVGFVEADAKYQSGDL